MAKNEELKKENVQAIRSCFYQGGAWTKNTLAECTGLSLAGTTNILQELQETGEILYTGDAASTGGRKSKEYILNQDFSHIGTIYCCRKGDKYSYRILDLDLGQEMLQDCSIYSDAGSLDDFKRALKWLRKDKNLQYIAVSIPGVCQNGRVASCDFPLLADQDLGSIIEQLCGVPYVIENDVNTACISYANQAESLQDIVLIYQPVREAIGCGILIHGALYNGFHHEAGEMKNAGFTDRDPLVVLLKAVHAVQAVLDPQKIIWCSDLVKEIDDPYQNLIHIQSLDTWIQNGLYQIAKHELLKLRKEEE